MKLKLTSPPVDSDMIRRSREFYKENENDRLKEKMSLDMVQNSADIWAICLSRPIPTSKEVLGEFKEITQKSLQYYWGSGAWCEFNENNKSIVCRHTDDRFVELKGRL